MIRNKIVWLSLSFATGCSAVSNSGQEEIDGAIVYANQCNRCHEYRSPTEFNGPQWSIISTHMRVIGGIPADESRAVFEYLKSQHHPAYVPPAVPAAVPEAVGPEKGKTLVQQRGCLGCHVVEGQGGTMGPSLDGVSERRSEAFVRQQLRDPRVNEPRSLMPNLGLTPQEVDALWAYLQTLEGPDGG